MRILPNPVLTVVVNPRQKVESGSRSGRYVAVHDAINSKNFPTRGRKSRRVTIAFAHFGKPKKTEAALKAISVAGYRPADLRELQQAGQKAPDLQEKWRVVALGSTHINEYDERLAPVLDNDDGSRVLWLKPTDQIWGEMCLFAVVRR